MGRSLIFLKQNMFKYFDKLVKKMSWVDVKLSALIGIGFGILLAKIGWFSNFSSEWIIVIIVLCYCKIFYSLFIKR